MHELVPEAKPLAIERLQGLGWHEHHAVIGVEAGFCCEYCGRDLLASVNDYDAWQLDHIVPSSQHGADDIPNKALCCKTCNFLKGIFVPTGTTRQERLASARNYIDERRQAKLDELQRIRAIAGLGAIGGSPANEP